MNVVGDGGAACDRISREGVKGKPEEAHVVSRPCVRSTCARSTGTCYICSNHTYRMLWLCAGSSSAPYPVRRHHSNDGFLHGQCMSRLYEKFLREYYRKEHPQLNAKALYWVLDDEASEGCRHAHQASRWSCAHHRCSTTRHNAAQLRQKPCIRGTCTRFSRT